MPAALLHSAARGLSVRHRRTRFARPPIGVRRDRLSIRMDVTYLLTHTIKSEDLTPFLRKLRNWSFRTTSVVSVRCRRPRFAQPPIGVRRDRLSVRTLLDGNSQSNLRTSLRYYVSGRSGSNLRTSLRYYVTDRSGSNEKVNQLFIHALHFSYIQ